MEMSKHKKIQVQSSTLQSQSQTNRLQNPQTHQKLQKTEQEKLISEIRKSIH